jgi:Transposase DDE domain/Transposase domain (DUF772)
MLGKRDGQSDLFRADHADIEHVGLDTVWGFLARHWRELFSDEDFADLYREGGRPSVPPSKLAVALLLQRWRDVSDAELINETRFDVRFKVALQLGPHEQLCAKSTYQHFRAQLVIHELDEKLFQRTVALAKKQKVLKRGGLSAALDTTPVLGRGAVHDTINLLGDGIRKLLRELATTVNRPLEEFVANLEDDHAELQPDALFRYINEQTSLKASAKIDWSDKSQMRNFVREVVTDADRLLTHARGVIANATDDADAVRVRESTELLALLLAQDIDRDGGPDDDPGPAIRKGTAKDRIVSTTDPDMRHGRKSSSKRFDGHKAAIAVDADSGVILDVRIHAGNSTDSHGALETVEHIEKQHDVTIDETLGDCAYGDGATRQDFADAGRKLLAKVPRHRRNGQLPKEDFTIDLTAGTVSCPAGQTTGTYSSSTVTQRGTSIKTKVFRFAGDICADCPLNEQCCRGRKGNGRSISIHPQEKLLKEARARQRTEAFRETYNQRQTVEHRLARLTQLGARQSRYFSHRKTMMQWRITAAVANLTLVLNKSGALLSMFLLVMMVFVFSTVTPAPDSTLVPASAHPASPAGEGMHHPATAAVTGTVATALVQAVTIFCAEHALAIEFLILISIFLLFLPTRPLSLRRLLSRITSFRPDF